MSAKITERRAALESYLIGCGEDRVVLLGDYVMERAGENNESPVEVSESISGPEYEQLELSEAFESSEVS